MSLRLVILTICASLVVIGFAAPPPAFPPPGALGGLNLRVADPSADSLFLPPTGSDLQAVDPTAMSPDAAGPLDVGSTED
ncbi:hypothetical protein BCV72DRAFT_338834 [Rhizopus microsporus var. microsporus]|uniref:Secreted protein n=2 Tax=Rhizopus microsporus TaxID=58291 RepID=A0A2G4SX83_RHIZD|nr:uncharacterized protein RHIMIDRAFT_291125 [Rhizopus microsporus ATCC 52813]ORE02246.1 hypothetical protein BCV72DRAFT_338834 [Rhizopus microsporus var. microsporus]PHZ13379.1 hypothetical protein RHIMIDRAFT_291125 [Rhizopus microsporus ATCC 52813]